MAIDLLAAIETLPRPELLVVGDLVLDRYVAGEVARISPEAPIQVLRQAREYERPGGMSAVARNLVRLGAKVHVAGLVGADAEAERIKERLAAEGMGLEGVVAEMGRPTTVKTRFVAESQHGPQQILRVDRETNEPPVGSVREGMLRAIEGRLPHVDAVVLSDYAKGVLTRATCKRLIAAAREAGVPLLVDPKGDFAKYRGATAMTPNRAEAGAATGVAIRGDRDAAKAARALLERYDLGVAFITLDRDGIFVQPHDERGVAIKTDPREVYDVTGAGDNVIATIAYCIAGGLDPVRSAFLANVAAGIAVEHFGVVTVGWDEIAARIAAGQGGDAKLVEPEMLDRLLESAREAGRKVVFTNGCFDVLHVGHVDLLRRARASGDLLVVGLNTDRSICRLKGESRPVNDLRARAAVLGGLSSVDYLVAFEEDTPEGLIRRIRPDVLVKGADWEEQGVVGREFVEGYGGRVELMPLLEGHSTTAMLERLERKDGTDK